MRIMGTKQSGETCVYEVIGFNYLKEKNTINCPISDVLTLHIQGRSQSITETISKTYSNELFNTGKLNLIEEDVIISLSTSPLAVHIKSHEWKVGVPVYLAGHQLNNYSCIPIDIVRRSY